MGEPALRGAPGYVATVEHRYAWVPGRRSLVTTLGPGGQLTWGRGSSNDVIVPWLSMSRWHGRIYVGPDFVTVTRLPESRAGLWWEAADGTPPRLIEPGETVVGTAAIARLLVEAPAYGVGFDTLERVDEGRIVFLTLTTVPTLSGDERRRGFRRTP